MRAGAWHHTHALRTSGRRLLRSRSRYSTLQNLSSQQHAKPACPYHPFDPLRARLVGHRRRCALSDSPLHMHGRAHMARPMRARSTARAHLSSPRPLSQPPRAASLIVLLLVCCRAECARRHVPNWTRRNLGGISAVAHGPDGISAVSGRPHCRRRLVCSARAAAPLPLSRNACLVPRAAETATHSPRACPGCIQTKPCALRHGACLTRPTTWAAPAAVRAPEPAESASPWQSPSASARVRSSSLRWSA